MFPSTSTRMARFSSTLPRPGLFRHLEVRVDSVNRLSGSNVDTKGSSNASANVIAFRNNVSGSSSEHQDFYIDDLYTCDGQGRPTTTSSATAGWTAICPRQTAPTAGRRLPQGRRTSAYVDEATPNDVKGAIPIEASAGTEGAPARLRAQCHDRVGCTRFGNTEPDGDGWFDLEVVASTEAGGVKLDAPQEEVREFFAPAQFWEMSVDENAQRTGVRGRARRDPLHRAWLRRPATRW